MTTLHVTISFLYVPHAENAGIVEKEELLAELQLMKSMEPHENILNLLGQCTTGDGPVCLIVEFATYGNLRDFLRQCEEVVLSLNHLPHIPRNRYTCPLAVDTCTHMLLCFLLQVTYTDFLCLQHMLYTASHHTTRLCLYSRKWAHPFCVPFSNWPCQ